MIKYVIWNSQRINNNEEIKRQSQTYQEINDWAGQIKL